MCIFQKNAARTYLPRSAWVILLDQLLYFLLKQSFIFLSHFMNFYILFWCLSVMKVGRPCQHASSQKTLEHLKHQK